MVCTTAHKVPARPCPRGAKPQGWCLRPSQRVGRATRSKAGLARTHLWRKAAVRSDQPNQPGVIPQRRHPPTQPPALAVRGAASLVLPLGALPDSTSASGNSISTMVNGHFGVRRLTRPLSAFEMITNAGTRRPGLTSPPHLNDHESMLRGTQQIDPITRVTARLLPRVSSQLESDRRGQMTE